MWLRAAATEGKAALPVSVVAALVLWRLSRSADLADVAVLAACALTAALWIAIDKKYALIRIRTQMLSCVYVYLASCLLFPEIRWSDACAGLCLCGAYYFMFGAYQQPRAAGHVFHAFCCLAVGSLFFTPLICFAPFLLFYLGRHERALSWRTFWAAMVGLAVPYWFKAAWKAYNGGFSWVAEACKQAGTLPPTQRGDFHAAVECFPVPHPTAGLHAIDFNVIAAADWTAIAAVGVLVLFCTPAAVHCCRTSFNDKIRTRIYLYMLVWQEYLMIAFILLQPMSIMPLSAVLVMNSAPLLSHYFALGRGRVVDIMFILFVLSYLALYVSVIVRDLF